MNTVFINVKENNDMLNRCRIGTFPATLRLSCEPFDATNMSKHSSPLFFHKKKKEEEEERFKVSSGQP